MTSIFFDTKKVTDFDKIPTIKHKISGLEGYVAPVSSSPIDQYRGNGNNCIQHCPPLEMSKVDTSRLIIKDEIRTFPIQALEQLKTIELQTKQRNLERKEEKKEVTTAPTEKAERVLTLGADDLAQAEKLARFLQAKKIREEQEERIQLAKIILLDTYRNLEETVGENNAVTTAFRQFLCFLEDV
jgi:hypothetical protein